MPLVVSVCPSKAAFFGCNKDDEMIVVLDCGVWFIIIIKALTGNEEVLHSLYRLYVQRTTRKQTCKWWCCLHLIYIPLTGELRDSNLVGGCGVSF